MDGIADPGLREPCTRSGLPRRIPQILRSAPHEAGIMDTGVSLFDANRGALPEQKPDSDYRSAFKWSLLQQAEQEKCS